MKKLSRVHKFFRYQKKPKLQDKWTKGWEVQPNNTENTSNKTVAENFINIEEKVEICVLELIGTLKRHNQEIISPNCIIVNTLQIQNKENIENTEIKLQVTYKSQHIRKIADFSADILTLRMARGKRSSSSQSTDWVENQCENTLLGVCLSISTNVVWLSVSSSILQTPSLISLYSLTAYVMWPVASHSRSTHAEFWWPLTLKPGAKMNASFFT